MNDINIEIKNTIPIACQTESISKIPQCLNTSITNTCTKYTPNVRLDIKADITETILLLKEKILFIDINNRILFTNTTILS